VSPGRQRALRRRLPWAGWGNPTPLFGGGWGGVGQGRRPKARGGVGGWRGGEAPEGPRTQRGPLVVTRVWRSALSLHEAPRATGSAGACAQRLRGVRARVRLVFGRICALAPGAARKIRAFSMFSNFRAEVLGGLGSFAVVVRELRAARFAGIRQLPRFVADNA